VVVGWNDTSQSVSSVSDALGNSYALVVGATEGSGISQSIYYSANIEAGLNSVTVNFSGPATYPDVRVLEYSGLSKLDNGTGVSGSSGSSSVNITTHGVPELVIAANTVSGLTTSSGSGFTQRILTTPDGDIVEDAIESAAGTFTASASVNGGNWVMQAAAFGNGNPTPTPAATSVNLAWDSNPPTNDSGTKTIGYRLHVGPASGNYRQTIDVGTLMAATVSNLESGSTYYFAVDAYNAAGIEGPYSNEVSYTAP
jgi:hypothetical protein